MKDYIASQDLQHLTTHGLNTFESLWHLQLENVDEPNSERGGWSTVSFLNIGGQGYYLKRQSNHLTKSLIHPFGEPTFAKEFRNIQRYQTLGIPTVTPAFFAMRKQSCEKQAILLTHALSDWSDLETYLVSWQQLSPEAKIAVIKACGLLLKQLHDHKVMHGCFYPKHIFLKIDSANDVQTTLIDLEKTRHLYLGKKDRIKELDTLVRRTKHYWVTTDYQVLLSTYLAQPIDSEVVNCWLQQVLARSKDKESRA